MMVVAPGSRHKGHDTSYSTYRLCVFTFSRPSPARQGHPTTSFSVPRNGHTKQCSAKEMIG